MASQQGRVTRVDDTGPDAGPSDRTARFVARLDGYLLTLADDAARRAFLDRQLEGWEYRYSRFVATEGASEPTADRSNPPQAADFLLTITVLAARRDALAGRRTRHERAHERAHA
jgi:hypothetical protein